MKKNILLLFLPLLLLPLVSFDNEQLIGQPMPLLANKTLDGKTIDEGYFQNHITLVSFMYIGCPPCMNEIGILNKLKSEYSADSRFQLLCVARQMKEQMQQFNSDNSSMFSKIRKALSVDSMEYSVQPACSNEKSRMDSSEGNVTLKSECSTIEEKYGVVSYPTIFFVDKKGVIRKIDTGGPPTRNDTAFYNKLKQELTALLNE